MEYIAELLHYKNWNGTTIDEMQEWAGRDIWRLLCKIDPQVLEMTPGRRRRCI